MFIVSAKVKRTKIKITNQMLKWIINKFGIYRDTSVKHAKNNPHAHTNQLILLN